jgi:hypothetical protein
MICRLAKALDARGDIGIASGGNRGDASEKTAADSEGSSDGSLGLRLRWLREDFTVVLRRGRDQTHAGRFMRLDGRGHGYILTSVGSRVALASLRVIGTKVS